MDACHLLVLWYNVTNEIVEDEGGQRGFDYYNLKGVMFKFKSLEHVWLIINQF